MSRMNVNEAVRDALFASPLQPSDTPTAEMVAEAIGSTVRRLGATGCSGQVAEEFGNHPVEATDRMRWIRQLTGDLCGCMCVPAAPPATAASAGSDMLPISEAA